MQSARSEQVIDGLLKSVQKTFYSGKPKTDFFRDRRTLMKHLMWPAAWMDKRGVGMPSQAYQNLLEERITDIADNGNWHRMQYFPVYFLKCLQDYFTHNEDKIYYELKGAGNVFEIASTNLANLKVKDEDPTVRIMAQAHKIWKPAKKKNPVCKPVANDQLDLF